MGKSNPLFDNNPNKSKPAIGLEASKPNSGAYFGRSSGYETTAAKSPVTPVSPFQNVHLNPKVEYNNTVNNINKQPSKSPITPGNAPLKIRTLKETSPNLNTSSVSSFTSPTPTTTGGATTTGFTSPSFKDTYHAGIRQRSRSRERSGGPPNLPKPVAMPEIPKVGSTVSAHKQAIKPFIPSKPTPKPL